jgi:hypothetical protein
MIINPNWTVSDQGPWQLIYNNQQIIYLHEAQGTTSTQGNLFVGTKEECEAEITRLGLPFPQVEDPEIEPLSTFQTLPNLQPLEIEL